MYRNTRWKDITCVQDAVIMGEDPKCHDFITADNPLCAICDKEEKFHSIELKVAIIGQDLIQKSIDLLC